jgi:hypothetical protein
MTLVVQMSHLSVRIANSKMGDSFGGLNIFILRFVLFLINRDLIYMVHIAMDFKL